jgi:hypothetical protein
MGVSNINLRAIVPTSGAGLRGVHLSRAGDYLLGAEESSSKLVLYSPSSRKVPGFTVSKKRFVTQYYTRIRAR